MVRLVGPWLACTISLFAPAVRAQLAPPAIPDIVVTGSHVRGSAIGETEPVAVLDQDAIHALGVPSLGELLKRLKGLTNSANGSDPVFLLNGRRISGFTEIQGLPPEAMERVEVLGEQDAARFGFAPTMRVLNFITKARFRALTTQQLAGTTTEGGGATNYTDATATRIDHGRRTSLDMSWFRQDPVLQSQRDILPDPDARFAIGGNVAGAGTTTIDPALDALAGRPVTIAAVPADAAARRTLAGYVATANAPAVTDIGRFRSLVQRNDTIRVDGTVAAPIGRAIDGSLNLTMEAQRSAGFNGLAPAALTVPSGGALPFADAVTLYRYIPGAVLRQHNDGLNLRAGGTVQGGLRRWNWNVTGTYDRVLAHAYAERGVPLGSLQASIDAGSDPFAPVDAVSVDARVADRSRTLTGTFGTRAVANGPLLRLPAGEALLTLSADYARSSSRGSQPGTVDSMLALSRTTGGASINADLPIASADRDVLPFMGSLSANAMLGVSQVSRFGRLTNANYGLNWAPSHALRLAASINETQTPPPIALLAAPVLTVPNTPIFDFTQGASVLVTTVEGGDPTLAPERRRTTTLGVGVTPIRGKEMRATLDYVDTRIVDQTGTLGSATAAFQAAFPSRFVRDVVGRLVRVDLRSVNLPFERERKLRLSANLWTPLGRTPPAPAKPAAGTAAIAPPAPSSKPRPSIFLNLNVNYRLSDRLGLGEGFDSLDLLDGATLNGTSGRPRWDVDGNLSFSDGLASISLYGRLQGPTRIRSDIAASDLSFTSRTWITLYGTLDAERLVARSWARRLSVQLTAENMLNDRIAVRDRDGGTPNRFQSAYLDPIGRSIRIGVRKLF